MTAHRVLIYAPAADKWTEADGLRLRLHPVASSQATQAALASYRAAWQFDGSSSYIVPQELVDALFTRSPI